MDPGILAIIIAAVALVVAAMGLLRGRRPLPEVTRAQRFELLDRSGMLRATLSTDPDGRAALTIGDASGTARARVAVNIDGTPAFYLYAASGDLRTSLGVASDDTPALSLYDSQGRSRARLSLLDSGEPVLGLSDAAGTPRVLAGMVDSGDGLIAIADSAGQHRAELFTGDGVPSLKFRDVDGNVRVDLQLGAEDVPSIFLRDANGKARAGLSVPRNRPTLCLWDAAGMGRAIMAVDTDGTPATVLNDHAGRPFAGLNVELGSTAAGQSSDSRVEPLTRSMVPDAPEQAAETGPNTLGCPHEREALQPGKTAWICNECFSAVCARCGVLYRVYWHPTGDSPSDPAWWFFDCECPAYFDAQQLLPPARWSSSSEASPAPPISKASRTSDGDPLMALLAIADESPDEVAGGNTEAAVEMRMKMVGALRDASAAGATVGSHTPALVLGAILARRPVFNAKWGDQLLEALNQRYLFARERGDSDERDLARLSATLSADMTKSHPKLAEIHRAWAMAVIKSIRGMRSGFPGVPKVDPSP